MFSMEASVPDGISTSSIPREVGHGLRRFFHTIGPAPWSTTWANVLLSESE